MRSLFAPVAGMMATLSWGCGECGPSPTKSEQVDWSGVADDGAKIGCFCECGADVVCYETTAGTCSTGTASDAASGTVKVETTGGTFVLTDSQVSELLAACGATSDTACDTAE
jgi:hypothetical protein